MNLIKIFLYKLKLFYLNIFKSKSKKKNIEKKDDTDDIYPLW